MSKPDLEHSAKTDPSPAPSHPTIQKGPALLGAALGLFWAVMAVVIWVIGSRTPQARDFGQDVFAACPALLDSADRTLVIDPRVLSGTTLDQIGLGCVAAAGSQQAQLMIALGITVVGTIAALGLVVRASRQTVSEPRLAGRSGRTRILVISALLLVIAVGTSIVAHQRWAQPATVTVQESGQENNASAGIAVDCLALNTSTSLTGAHSLFSPTTPGALSGDLADLLEQMDLPEDTSRPQASAALAEDITYTCLHARERQLAQLNIVFVAAGVFTAAVIGGALVTRRPTTARVNRD